MSSFLFIGLGPKENFKHLFTDAAAVKREPSDHDGVVAVFQIDKNGHPLSYVFVPPEELSERLASAQKGDYKEHQITALEAAIREARARSLIPA